ncbi:hypothetical protein BELL_0015g00260 [Botrytis elliptica]|uniref:Uncharacterized protein n=1 Tax=Botrytis elliptica TaxID=278938 RepID=A0A4Z1KFV9_9HELO|nr:hypothetical protein BELL_0015g00260 [Botrytis elliptica]
MLAINFLAPIHLKLTSPLSHAKFLKTKHLGEISRNTTNHSNFSAGAAAEDIFLIFTAGYGRVI